MPGVLPLLDAIVEAGAKQAIGSSAPRRNIEMILETSRKPRQVLRRAIEAMEDVAAAAKPNPEVFLLGAKKLGVPPERCIVLEDAPVGIQAASKAGGMSAQRPASRFINHHPAEKLRASWGGYCRAERPMA